MLGKVALVGFLLLVAASVVSSVVGVVSVWNPMQLFGYGDL